MGWSRIATKICCFCFTRSGCVKLSHIMCLLAEKVVYIYFYHTNCNFCIRFQVYFRITLIEMTLILCFIWIKCMQFFMCTMHVTFKMFAIITIRSSSSIYDDDEVLVYNFFFTWWGVQMYTKRCSFFPLEIYMVL